MVYFSDSTTTSFALSSTQQFAPVIIVDNGLNIINTAVSLSNATGSLSSVTITTGSNITITTTGSLIVTRMDADYQPVQRSAILKEVIRSNLLIKTKSRTSPIGQSCSPQEVQARHTLRDMLTEKEWRGYVTNGFIIVKGASGLFYQIKQKGSIVVYKDGNPIHSICIHTDKSCPPTDHIINMKLLIEFDEAVIWRKGNVRDDVVRLGNLCSTVKFSGNLLDIYKQLVLAA